MVSIIIPVYNESENIEIVTNRISHELREYESYEIIFIDDGSEDSTLEKIKTLAALDKNIKYISFSRNFGHQNALMAGIEYANGDCVISMDSDMQHPPEIIRTMIDKWKEGSDIVYSVRKDSTETGLFKKLSSSFFYKLINMVSEIDIPLGAADFRLLDRKVILELRKFKENWIFLRGIIAWLGFKQDKVEYVVQQRYAGKSKYSFGRMFSLAIQGITSFSVMPLRISAFLGVLFSIGSFIYIMYALYAKFFIGTAMVGWASVLISVLFLGGIQLIFLGILGEYLGKMFIETKNRPNYIINEKNI